MTVVLLLLTPTTKTHNILTHTYCAKMTTTMTATIMMMTTTMMTTHRTR